MHDVPRSESAKEPLFIIELFDHDAQLSIDSRLCYGIADGASAFETFMSRQARKRQASIIFSNNLSAAAWYD